MDYQENIKLDTNNSIPNRDLELERALFRTMREAWVKRCIDTLEPLYKETELIRDDTYHGIKSNHHIVFKYLFKNGSTMLISKDGHRGYEFLIEFDVIRPELGIYYGCRGAVLEGDQEKENHIFFSEWKDKIENELCHVLNNTFIDLDFSNRFRLTDNANNKTFWPFWIVLGDDEDIIEVAARATKLIAKTYKCFLDGEEFELWEDPTKELNVKTLFTHDAYQSSLSKLEKTRGKNTRRMFERFIAEATKHKIIERDHHYEYCWKFVDLQNVEVAHLYASLAKRIGLQKPKSDKIPWEYLKAIFLSKSGETFESISKSFNISNDNGVGDHVKNANDTLANLGIPLEPKGIY